MNSSKNSLSGLRYFKAGLKPFKKFRFWAPPSAIAIIALCYWQYRSNPAWLNTSFEQPEGVENVLSNDPSISQEQEIGLEMPLQSIAREAENQQGQEQLPLIDPLSPQGITSPTTEQENGQGTASPEGTFGLDRLTQNKKGESKEESQASSIFTPLMPNIKNPSSIFSNNSNSQRQNNSANPPALSPIDGLMKPKPVTVTDNPLQQAMDRTDSGDAASPTEVDAATTTNQPQSPQFGASEASSSNASSQPQQTNNNFSNPSAATQPLTQNAQPQPPYYYSPPGNANPAQSNSSPMQGYQNPYLNSPVQTNPTQPSNQSYQQPSYNNAPFPIPGGSAQVPAQAYQNPTPYLNNPVPQTPPITQNQFNQPNYSNNPAGTAQVQSAIEEFGGD